MNKILLSLMAFVIALLPLTAQAQEISIKSFVGEVYIEGVPYEQVIRFDARTAAPILLEMMADPAEEANLPNIVVTLGMLGDDRAVEPLIRFIETSSSREALSRAQYVARTSAVISLGYIVNKAGNKQALEYLMQSVQPQVWRGRQVTWISPFHSDPNDRNAYLSKMAILGLGLTGAPEAAETLRSLQMPASTEDDRVFRDKVAPVVEEALRANETIGRIGLVEYYRVGNSR